MKNFRTRTSHSRSNNITYDLTLATHSNIRSLAGLVGLGKMIQ